MVAKVGPIGKLLFRGVLIESRYGEVDELHYMQAAIAALSDADVNEISRLFCNSKVSNMGYWADLKPGADVRRLCEYLGEALAKAHEGYVCITASDDRTSHDCECDATPI
jgi:hypothetical protein